MDIHELIRYRKSVRSWENRDVEPAMVERIVESARYAPSAKNGQEWHVIAVTDAGKRKKLGNDIAGQPFVSQAPVILAVCGDTTVGDMRCGQPRMPVDIGTLTDHLMLVAAHEGLGTCWIGAFDGGEAATLLDVPNGWAVAALLPLGYPDDASPITKSRRSLDDLLSWETY